MSRDIFTGEDLKMIAREGLSPKAVSSQIETFKRGAQWVKLKKPCTIGDGIVVIPDSERAYLIEVHHETAREGKMIKFVPASGAASRMFKDWFRYDEMEDFDTTQAGVDFGNTLPSFAFYGDLQSTIANDGEDLPSLIRHRQFRDIIEYILTPRGLNYAHLPKALLQFHVYPDHTRTSLEEHLVEAALYVKDAHAICRIHFTVSEEHRKEVHDYILRIKESYENTFNVTYDISLSIQLPSTNTIAVDIENKPFRMEGGGLVFRPGGHGALIKNLNDIDADIIFIKNIDNVTPDRLKPEITLHKKILGGYLARLQKEVYAHMELLEDGPANEKSVAATVHFCKEKLFLDLPPEFADRSLPQKVDIVKGRLNRPLRVCGMVKNIGEPGGGPFWIERDGVLSLQIIEQAQIDPASDEQQRIWSSSTHFNPVDLACGIKDHKGQKFDLEKFVDEDTYLISEKSLEGRNLKALELPGLWNGAMAGWNTVFAEVPITTFSPVKTIYDLLRKEHREAK